ncbi:hypothetical protein CEXT_441061 [Caerostris extrusa]|uniref:Uncharacterized protein n=1 Tax=Caerostris extrusa TaxID=172846 RepID=A0AAV4NE24_CAEEX|nr:hypothetical protein CEXT_441061 [Caerostris extrusa]
MEGETSTGGNRRLPFLSHNGRPREFPKIRPTALLSLVQKHDESCFRAAGECATMDSPMHKRFIQPYYGGRLSNCRLHPLPQTF